MKKILIFNSLILSGLIFSGCGTTNTGQLKTIDNIQQAPVVSDVITPTTTDENNLNVYKNENYGFSLIFPDTWKNYITKENVTTLGKTIYFGFSGQETGLFAVNALTKAKWAEIKNEDGPKPTYLGENDKYVFGWTPAQYTANDQMNERMKEVNSIIQTFKLVNNSNTPSGQVYNDSVNNYSYVCPDDFVLSSNLDFNGKIKTSECTKNYSDKKISFDDGVSINFEFIPTKLADTFKNGDKLWSVQKIDDIRLSSGVKTYSKNNFSGFYLAGDSYSRIIARQIVDNGYYEVNVTIAANNKNDMQKRKELADKIIESFLFK